MTQYLVHKAVEFSSVQAKVRKTLCVNDVDGLANRYMAQRKYDGCNGILIVKPNEQTLLSRTGEIVKSCDHIKRSGRAALRSLMEKGQSHVLLGEVWRGGVDYATISGEFRKQSEQRPQLKFVVFDMLTCEEFEAGKSERPFSARSMQAHLYFRGAHASDTMQLCETYNEGTYGLPSVMCNELVAKGGYDGLILRDPSAGWQAGSGTAGEIIKVKARQSYDLRVVGLEEGKGRNAGRVGALVVNGPKGKVKVNSGTDAQREVWWKNPDEIVGKVVEVFCLGFTNTGSLREPTLGSIRFDKEKADFE